MKSLKPSDPHPVVNSAKKYILGFDTVELLEWFDSARRSEAVVVCQESFKRLVSGKPVSDRYLLGLAWFLKTEVEDER
jgi:hypothetical protein